MHGVPPVKNIEESIDLLAWHVGRTDHESGFKNKKFVSQAGEEVVFEESGGHWSGPGDHSSAVSFGWAADRLLVVAHVVDDEHVHSGGGGQCEPTPSKPRICSRTLMGCFVPPPRTGGNVQSTSNFSARWPAALCAC